MNYKIGVMTNESKEENLINQNNMFMYDNRVGFGRRLGAYLLDILVIVILGILLSSIAGDFFANLFFSDQLAEIETTSALFDEMNFDYEGIITKS